MKPYDFTEPRSSKPYPSIPAVVFFIWALTVPLVFSARLLNADGDLLRHLRHGEWMLRHRALLHEDMFSFTRGGDPFVAFEYGSQLLYAAAHRIGGLSGVAILASLLIAGSYALLARFLLSRRADALLTYLVSIVSAILGAVHWTARPHLFTLFAVMAMLFVLEPGERRPRLWLLVPAYALWANVHGGFVFGLTLLGIYLAGSVAEWWGKRGTPGAADDVRYYAGALGAGLLGSLLNPNGWGLHLHIIHFFGEPFLRDNTHEFLSPDFHGAGGKMLLISLLAVVASFALVPGRPTLPRLFLVLANIAFALQARRNIQLYAATVFPILALHFDPAWRRLPDWRGLRAIFERDARRGSNTIFIAGVTAVLCVLGVLHGRVGSLDLVPDRLDPKEFPVAAVAKARSARLQGRIFHDFVWGGYLLYAWPEQRVFIDGGTDFYGPALMRTYMDVSGIQPGWRDTLAARNISLVLMPTGSAMTNELARDGDWRVWYCDQTATLLKRDSMGDGRAAATAQVPGCATGR
ncbi:MAG: hypothetical protein H0T86_04405 [Gemmatimonadales bacterium]|nr:hypothetical protein [Gemmatimonadales bacterium]